MRAAQHLEVARHGAASVLVKQVRRVVLIPFVAAPPVATAHRHRAVANVVKAVFELLPQHRGAVGPEALASDELAQGIVLVEPVGTVRVGLGYPLVGQVVAVGCPSHQVGAGPAFSLGQAVELVVLVDGGHDRQGV